MRARTLTLLAASATALAVPASARAAVPWTACGQPAAPAMQCGTVAVPLDRSGRQPGAIALQVRRVPATGAASDTAVLALAGGPGQSAASLTPSFAQLLTSARATRDLLVLDQRGTGGSGPLWCQALATPASRRSLPDAGAACAAQLGARRGLYRTADSVADIEAVREASGYARLAIFAVSYGTKVALEYAATYPHRVERLVLDSVVPPQGPDPLARSTFAALPRVLRELCANGACRGVTHAPTRTLRAIVRRLARKPLRSSWVDDRGRERRVTITRQGLLAALLRGDTNPALRADVPAALGAWRRGDVRPLARLVARTGARVTLAPRASARVNPAVYAATQCEEVTFPWSRRARPAARLRQAEQAVRALSPADFAPFDRETALGSELLRLCLRWPTASPPPPALGGVPAVPTLILSGGGDLRTPTEDAQRLAARLPAPPQFLAVPWVGHSVLGSEIAKEACAARALAAFFGGAPIPGCTTASAPISVAARPAARLSGQRTVASLRGRLGRTVGAALDTVTDLRRQVLYEALERGRMPRRVGALRGGYATVENGNLRLRAARYVGGVRVSGQAPRNGDIRLRVSGGGALRGTVTVSADMLRIRGRLGGRRFSVTRSRAAARADRLPAPEDVLRAFAPGAAG